MLRYNRINIQVSEFWASIKATKPPTNEEHRQADEIKNLQRERSSLDAIRNQKVFKFVNCWATFCLSYKARKAQPKEPDLQCQLPRAH